MSDSAGGIGSTQNSAASSNAANPNFFLFFKEVDKSRKSYEARKAVLNNDIKTMKQASNKEVKFEVKGLPWTTVFTPGDKSDQGYILATGSEVADTIDVSGRTSNSTVVTNSSRQAMDTLIGANGKKDVFAFDTKTSNAFFNIRHFGNDFDRDLEHNNFGNDTIENFEVGRDKIDLSGMTYDSDYVDKFKNDPNFIKENHGNRYTNYNPKKPTSVDDLDIRANEDGDAVIYFKKTDESYRLKVGSRSQTFNRSDYATHTESYKAASITVKGVTPEQLCNECNFKF